MTDVVRNFDLDQVMDHPFKNIDKRSKDLNIADATDQCEAFLKNTLSKRTCHDDRGRPTKSFTAS